MKTTFDRLRVQQPQLFSAAAISLERRRVEAIVTCV